MHADLPPRHATCTRKIALVLQGGGALGSSQAGVHEALARPDYEPGWVAGISIGAVNAAIIAGNAPEHRVEKLRSFWETVTVPPNFYETAVLKATLESLVDFDRINIGGMRRSVGAVTMRTGNFACFDSAEIATRPEHIMARGALPPGCGAIEIDGEHVWDGRGDGLPAVRCRQRRDRRTSAGDRAGLRQG